MRSAVLAAAVVCLGFTANGIAATDGGAQGAAAGKLDHEAALKYSQSAVGRRVGDYRFVDRSGATVSMSRFRGKPLVISLIYTSCYHTCPTLTRELARAVKIARDALGEDSFNVVTIGFDAREDTPGRMKSFARERGIDIPHWWFLSTDEATITALARDVGFLYYPSPRGFDHLTQTTVVDAEGRVYRQVYGELVNPPAFVEPLKELVFGMEASPNVLSGWLNGIKLFCTVYDPSSGRYRFDYSLFVALGVGVMSLGAILIFVIRAWRESKPG